METDLVQKPMKLFEIWRNVFLRPTIETYSRISNDPKASIKWGLIWAAVTVLVTWVVGPQRELLGGYVVNAFGGRETFLYFSVIGAPIGIISIFRGSFCETLAKL